ncbi:hypothetical protein MACH08_10370 [Oceanobacillus kimchii]|uniref:Uncharacterized protein n=1 Tax=Oceanobacillus kimchii TaxID=746691 RepID=A0ABQ5TEK0_9BACI|nr:hypothetical protein MACH08_10370 [Oceanobacillus kimchii]
MNYLLFTLYAILLAVLAFFTGEIVTFIMLGIILVALQNIHGTLKNIFKILKENKSPKV